jgi:L-asparaginase/Glu-tRNA(Gln) amidotransferase subunit D
LGKAGVISSGDMMLEATLTKSMYLMGSGLEGEDFKKILNN